MTLCQSGVQTRTSPSSVGAMAKRARLRALQAAPSTRTPVHDRPRGAHDEMPIAANPQRPSAQGEASLLLLGWLPRRVKDLLRLRQSRGSLDLRPDDVQQLVQLLGHGWLEVGGMQRLGGELIPHLVDFRVALLASVADRNDEFGLVLEELPGVQQWWAKLHAAWQAIRLVDFLDGVFRCVGDENVHVLLQALALQKPQRPLLADLNNRRAKTASAALLRRQEVEPHVTGVAAERRCRFAAKREDVGDVHQGSDDLRRLLQLFAYGQVVPDLPDRDATARVDHGDPIV
mmetsp:Transcript_45563/g.126449  ORF Transcript_45563/g.126449 Transcript_45563/m.126449 type:complete len:288 (-) Transcript_45563:1752-2615(-)